MIRPIFVVAAGIALLSLPASAEAASFNCHRTLIHTEAAICDNAKLSALDTSLSALYRRVLKIAAPIDRPFIVRDQVRWLGKRNACGANTKCIASAYTSRIEFLTGDI